jgi:ketosteroid isomerase-like protein
MKTLLTLLAAAGLVAGAAFAAEKWTKPQQEVADVFKAWAEAEKAGDVDRLMSLTSPAFTGWDFAASGPLDRSAFRQEAAEFFRGSRVIKCAVNVMSVDIQGGTAIAYSRYTETIQAAPGITSVVQGVWSTTLIRDRAGWLILSQSWLADRPKVDEAAIRDEVKQAFLAFKAACESAKPAAQLAFYADVPEFRYVDIDGKRYDYAGHKQLVTELFAGLSAVKIDLGRYEITVLGADKALVLWTGALDLVQKEGPALRAEPYSVTFLWKRLGGAWKLVLQAESALAPQPVPSVAAAKP